MCLMGLTLLQASLPVSDLPLLATQSERQSQQAAKATMGPARQSMCVWIDQYRHAVRLKLWIVGSCCCQMQPVPPALPYAPQTAVTGVQVPVLNWQVVVIGVLDTSQLYSHWCRLCLTVPVLHRCFGCTAMQRHPFQQLADVDVKQSAGQGRAGQGPVSDLYVAMEHIPADTLILIGMQCAVSAYASQLGLETNPPSSRLKVMHRCTSCMETCEQLR